MKAAIAGPLVIFLAAAIGANATAATVTGTISYTGASMGKTYVGAYGTVTIAKNIPADKKLSGVFECTLYQSSGDSLKVTGGVITDLPYDITEQ